jgi:hypothetical protein
MAGKSDLTQEIEELVEKTLEVEEIVESDEEPEPGFDIRLKVILKEG